MRENAPQNRLRDIERRALQLRVEGGIVVELAQPLRALEVRMPVNLLVHVRIQSEVLEEVIALEDAVLLDHPGVGFRDERLQDCRAEAGAIPRARHVADIAEQCADHRLVVFAGLVGRRRGEQGVLHPIHRKYLLSPPSRRK